MSADSGDEVPDDERLEWLQSLDDEQFERIRKVARGPVYTRRQIAKYLGTGAAAALAGGASTGAVAADASTSDSDGDVGTPSNRVDVYGDGADLASELLVDNPSPGTGSSANDVPVQISNQSSDSDGAIVLQNTDDDATGGATDQDSKAGVYWMSAGNTNGGDPQRMALLTADAHDEHFSLYTRNAPLGSDGQHVKRLDVPSNTAVVKPHWTRVSGLTLNSAENKYLTFHGPSGLVHGIEFGEGGVAQNRWLVRYRGDQSGGLEIRNGTTGTTALTISEDGTLNHQLSAERSFREVDNATASDLVDGERVFDPSNQRIVWKSVGGTTMYWNADGTL